jgi:hypothetical protein
VLSAKVQDGLEPQVAIQVAVQFDEGNVCVDQGRSGQEP